MNLESVNWTFHYQRSTQNTPARRESRSGSDKGGNDKSLLHHGDVIYVNDNGVCGSAPATTGMNESRRKARTSPSKHVRIRTIRTLHDFNQISVKSIVRTSSFIHRLTTSPNTWKEHVPAQ
jgi:calcineurin-like phosphoesterase